MGTFPFYGTNYNHKNMANYKQMDKVLDLAAKTGDKVIVMSDNHEPYVLMTVKEYEVLLHGSAAISVKDLSEDELLDKINRDIAIWKASQNDLGEYNLDQFKVDTIRKEDSDDHDDNDDNKHEEKATVDKSTVEEDDKYYIEPVD